MSTSNANARQVTKGGRRKNNNDRIYALPLPIEFEPTFLAKYLPISVLGLSGIATKRLKHAEPIYEGFLDIDTRSVWLLNYNEYIGLWRQGFFGKGHLSRSEPTWFSRHCSVNRAKTAEEMTAKRRVERNQFKLDRAAAVAAAARDAEIAFAEGRVPESQVVIPSAATWKPLSQQEKIDSSVRSIGAEDVEDEDVKSIEHLQLTYQEAFFLIWALNCLYLSDPSDQRELSLQEIWNAFQNSHLPVVPQNVYLEPPSRFDNPFIINYVIYHHYRSLGWVVKSGIKFCVDYLLYKRGPVFHHAEFAIVVCPVYEDSADEETSPYNLQNTKPFSWPWLSTINRVNSQVQKTLVLSYVTIPALSRLSPKVVSSPACLTHYSVREVILRRFIPARMRG